MHEMLGKSSTSSYFFLLVHLSVHISTVFAETIEYRLDDSWPKDKSVFSAPIFSVAVNQDNGDVYVAKVSKTRIKVGLGLCLTLEIVTG